MTLSAGIRLGPYEIVAALGAGGMGEVYQARDAKLGRTVALKTLPTQFSDDPERLARLNREARVLAGVNHPNVATLYDVEEIDGVRLLVMELVPGETLAERLARGPLPIDEALLVFRQIADGLAAAHDQHIIHRDLKPANIKITPDGRVKLLDFGLGKTIDADLQANNLASSPTVTALSRFGAIQGTEPYMSPEQARGKAVDRRTDIWAFGCCLYEALTGHHAFRGDTVSDTIAHILEREPAWSALPASVPTNIRTLLRRCLQKDPGRRLRDVWDVRVELEDASVEPASQAAGVVSHEAGRWKWVSAGLGTVALAALVFAAYPFGRSGSHAAGSAQRLAVLLPPDVRLTEVPANAAFRYDVALSPDDQQLVFVGTKGTVTQLYVRRADQYEWRPLPGTDDATMPFFSPDGSWVGFQSGGQLRKVSLASAGGIPDVICDLAGAVASAAWWADDEIVFASHAGLSRVVASGGTPETLTTFLPGEVAHDWPQVLSGDRILFTVTTSAPGQPSLDQTVVLSKTTRERHLVLSDARSGLALAGGHLIFLRAGSLWTVPFDEATGRVTGTPVPKVNDMFVRATIGSRSFASSKDSLLYVPGGLAGTLMWVERNGKTSPLFSEQGAYEHPMLSPDGKRVVFDSGLPGAKDLWVYDVQRGSRVRLTNSDGDEVFGVWTPDGNAVAYSGGNDLQRISVNGTGPPERLLSGDYPRSATSWSPDGRTLVYTETHPKTGRDIWQMQPGQEPTPILVTPFNESGAVVSPSGRFLAYVSDESGRIEAYVRPFPKGSEKWLISTNGGAEPVWSADGRELFYRENDTMMAVSVSFQPAFRAGVPRRLFEGRFDRNDTHQHYSAGGGRFLKVQRDQDVSPGRLHVILDLVEELKASASVGR